MSEPDPGDPPDDLIRAAKGGAPGALGLLFARYTGYLTLLARVETGRRLQGKVDPADVVQDTFLNAHGQFPGFRGATEPELVAWLRRILAGTIANTVRHYFGTQARDPRLEQDLAAGLDRSSVMMAGQLAGSDTSPSDAAARREFSVLFADALNTLADDYREVLVLRSLEELTFPQVAARMGRTVDSVEKLWLRAARQLRQVLGPRGEA